MSAFEGIQECERLNASGIVCIESVYEFKEPGMEYAFSRGVLRTARVLHHDLKKVASNF